MNQHGIHEKATTMCAGVVQPVTPCSDTDSCAEAAATTRKSEHTAHYPLDIHLPDYIYEHRPISARDLMLQRIMSDFMSPARVTPRAYGAYISYPAEFDQIKAQNQELGMDLKVFRKMLFTSHYHDPPEPGKPQVRSTIWEVSHGKRVLQSKDKPVAGPSNAPPTIGDEVIDLVQRHYFETDGAIKRLFLERHHPPRIPTGPRASRNGRQKLRVDAVDTFTRYVKEQQWRERKRWRDEDTEHLRRLSPAKGLEKAPNLNLLYDGGIHLAPVHRAFEHNLDGERLSKPSLRHYHFTMANPATGPCIGSIRFWERSPSMGCFIQPRWCDRRNMGQYCIGSPHFGPDRMTGRGRPKTRFFEEDPSSEKPLPSNHPHRRLGSRRRSEPPPGSFCEAKLPDPADKYLPGKLMVMFPRLPLSVIDRRSRRRSLSRSHVANMFDWDCKDVKQAKPSRADRKQEHEQQLTRKYWAQLRNGTLELPKDELPLYPPCPNCASKDLHLCKCFNPCGYCGAPNPKSFELLCSTNFPSVRSQAQQPVSRPAGPADPPADNVQETVITMPGGHTLIISGQDTIFLTSDGGISWTRWGGSRDRVHLAENVNRLEHVQAGDDDVSSEDEAHMYRVAVRGVGKHGNPHTTDKCPVPRGARCKCVPFPQLHTAARCRVRCSRDCGNPHARGSFKHRNAMTCKARCCMCGIRGHAGRSCRLKKCRCGGEHLGQDCTFRVECAVEGCDRFLCGLHCRSCGGTEKPFVEWECLRCRRQGGAEAETEIGVKSG